MRLDTFKELDEVQNRLSSLFRRLPWKSGEMDDGAERSPLVDISEDDKEYSICAELPELKKENVQVSLENGVLPPIK